MNSILIFFLTITRSASPACLAVRVLGLCLSSLFSYGHAEADEMTREEVVQLFSKQRDRLLSATIEYRRFEQGDDVRDLTVDELRTAWAKVESLDTESRFREFASSLLSDPNQYATPWVDAKLIFTNGKLKDMDSRNTFAFDGKNWVGERRRNGFREAVIGANGYPGNITNEGSFRWLLPAAVKSESLTVSAPQSGFVSFTVGKTAGVLDDASVLIDHKTGIVREVKVSGL